MATDWAADIKKYAPDADDAVIASMQNTYRLVLSNADTSAVAFSDPDEVATVREKFLKGKLGVTGSDDELDAAIRAVGQQMSGSNRKSRLTVYYLLAEKYGKLGMFA